MRLFVVCVFSLIHQESQNSGLNSRLSAVQEDLGKSPARKRLVCVCVCFLQVLLFIDLLLTVTINSLGNFYFVKVIFAI